MAPASSYLENKNFLSTLRITSGF
ncbi:rCG44796 [Rattus norvegicus]|uniref:RCG44796 n=1 Tax=Rattus norvegicus TaxID=10116 RepID=A6I4J3_RAT|nr:rCG44796 [Rattus norvegicus]